MTKFMTPVWAMDAPEVAEPVNCRIIAFLLLIHYFVLWPWPLTLWPWPLTLNIAVCRLWR